MERASPIALEEKGLGETQFTSFLNWEGDFSEAIAESKAKGDQPLTLALL